MTGLTKPFQVPRGSEAHIEALEHELEQAQAALAVAMLGLQLIAEGTTPAASARLVVRHLEERYRGMLEDMQAP